MAEVTPIVDVAAGEQVENAEDTPVEEKVAELSINEPEEESAKEEEPQESNDDTANQLEEAAAEVAPLVEITKDEEAPPEVIECHDEPAENRTPSGEAEGAVATDEAAE